MKILALDSSGNVATVGIAENDELIYEQYANTGLTHSKNLVPMIDNALAFCGLKPSDIDLYAVSKGPGSFTGIRIGISAVKAMSWACNKPCCGVSSLEALAWNNISSRDKICCVTDLVGGKLYNAFFESDGTQIIRLSEDAAMTPDELAEQIKSENKKCLLVGNAAEIFANYIQQCGTDVKIAPKNVRYQHAYGVARSAYASFLNNDYTTADGLLPSYIRIPQAEQERLNKIKGEKA